MTTGFENARAAACAAVAAHLAQDRETVGKLLHRLSADANEAIAAMTALVHVASVVTGIWARTIQEEPEKAWRTLMQTVALVSTPED